MKDYISKKEYEKCKQVKNIFDCYMENRSGLNEFCIADAYPFGFTVLEWYFKGDGFDTQTFFNNASILFDYLLKLWEEGFIYDLKEKYGNCEMLDKELEKIVSAEDVEKKNQIRRDIIMEYEKCAVLWDIED